MSAPKWTPGPWCVVIDESSQVSWFPNIEADGCEIVGSEGFYNDIDRYIHNANLAAAAPELYDELLRCSLILEDSVEGRAAFKRIEKALAKARGESCT